MTKTIKTNNVIPFRENKINDGMILKVKNESGNNIELIEYIEERIYQMTLEEKFYFTIENFRTVIKEYREENKINIQKALALRHELRLMEDEKKGLGKITDEDMVLLYQLYLELPQENTVSYLK